MDKQPVYDPYKIKRRIEKFLAKKSSDGSSIPDYIKYWRMGSPKIESFHQSLTYEFKEYGPITYRQIALQLSQSPLYRTTESLKSAEKTTKLETQKKIAEKVNSFDTTLNLISQNVCIQ